MHEMLPPAPPPAAGPNVALTNLPMVPHTEGLPVLHAVSDTLAGAWSAVKDGSKDSNMGGRLDAVGAFSVPVPSAYLSAVS
jgi:hypothetical protein